MEAPNFFDSLDLALGMLATQTQQATAQTLDFEKLRQSFLDPGEAQLSLNSEESDDDEDHAMDDVFE